MEDREQESIIKVSNCWKVVSLVSSVEISTALLLRVNLPFIFKPVPSSSHLFLGNSCLLRAGTISFAISLIILGSLVNFFQQIVRDLGRGKERE